MDASHTHPIFTGVFRRLELWEGTGLYQWAGEGIAVMYVFLSRLENLYQPFMLIQTALC